MIESKKSWWESLHPWQQFYVQIMCFLVLPVYFLTLKYSDNPNVQVLTGTLAAFTGGIYVFFWSVANLRDFKARLAANRVKKIQMLSEVGYVPPKKKELSERTWRYIVAFGLIVASLFMMNNPSFAQSWLPIIPLGVAVLCAYELALILLAIGAFFWIASDISEGVSKLSTPAAIIIGAIIIAIVIANKKE